jgi:mono/diheme cytochrome c family protein
LYLQLGIERKREGSSVKRILIGMVSLVFLGGALLSPGSGRGDEYERGKTLYENKCQMCHGTDGKGNGPAAAAFHPKPADFTNPDFWKRKDIDKFITDTIENGHGLMPAFNLKPDEIKAIIDYVSHTFRK